MGTVLAVALLTIITLKSDSWFCSAEDFFLWPPVSIGRVLMSSSGAAANGVVSGVRSKRPR